MNDIVLIKATPDTAVLTAPIFLEMYVFKSRG